MAAVLGARLVVVKLARPTRPRSTRRFLQGDALGTTTPGLCEARAVDRWQRARSRKGLPVLEVRVSAPTVEALVSACRAPGVAVVVIPSALSWFASGVTGLAARAGVPVLLAHAARGQERLVVASNLEDPSRPVIHDALDFAQRLNVPLTVVHNEPGLHVQRAAAGLAAGLPLRVPDEPDNRLELALANELAAAGHEAEVTVTHRGDTVSGILEAARVQDADLTVVGVRPRTAPALFADEYDSSQVRSPARPERSRRAPS